MFQDRDGSYLEYGNLSGTNTFNMGANVSWSMNGVIAESHFDDFYNTIHFNTLNLDIGNVLTSLSRPITVWNAFLESKAVSSFTASTTEGFGVIEPKLTPYTLNALEEIEYSVSVSETGPPSFNDSVSWVIDGTIYKVLVTGNRVVLWGFEPNWKTGVVETLSWKTSVVESYDGTEQRRQLRINPRRKTEYSSVLSGDSVTMMNSLLFGWQSRLFALPIWTDETKLSLASNVGDTVLSLSTLNKSFSENNIGVLFNSMRDFEVFEIRSKTDNGLELVEPLEREWQVGTRVLPIDLARTNQLQPFQYQTSNVLEISQEWNSSPGGTSLNINDTSPSDTFKGVELVDIKPNWRALVSVESEFGYEVFDGQVGGFDQVQTSKHASVYYKYQWVMKTKGAVQDFRDFLGRVKGRCKPFYIPTSTSDLQVVVDIELSSSVIYVKNCQLSKYVDVHPVRNAIVVYLKDGTTVKASVLGMSVVDDETEVISLNTTFNSGYTVSDISRVSFMHLCRLKSDDVVIEHLTDSVSTVEITVKTVQA